MPQPEWADLPPKEWKCDDCGAVNWWEDPECQFCDVRNRIIRDLELDEEVL